MTGDPRVPPGKAPGWYVDPQRQDVLRWWDGGRWTEATREKLGEAQASVGAAQGRARHYQIPQGANQTRSDYLLGGRDEGAWDADDRGDHGQRPQDLGQRPPDLGQRPQPGPGDQAGAERLRARGLNGLRAAAALTRAENWGSVRNAQAREEPAREKDEPDARRDDLARLSISALFGFSLLLLAAGFALHIDVVRLIALAGVLFFGVGAAPLQLVERSLLQIRLGVAVLVGVSVLLIVSSVMVLAPFWHPVALAVLIGAVAVVMHVIGCRRVLAGQSAGDVFRSARGTGAGFLDASLACTVLGTVLWLAGMVMTGHEVPGLFGFLTKVPVYWYLGLALVIVGIVLAKGEARMALGVVALDAALTITPAWVYGMPRSQSAAKHIDLVNQILQAHHLERTAGIYQAYSGFFSGIAWISDLTGSHNITAIATYWPFIVGVLALAEYRLFFGRMVSSGRKVWFVIVLAVLVDSIGADYFSPQSAGFVIALGAFALAIDGEIPGIGPRARVALLTLAGCAIAVTHELSPYIAGGVLLLFVVFRIIRPWYLPVALLLPAALWALVNKGVLSGFISFTDLGNVTNFAPPKTSSATGLARVPAIGDGWHALTLGIVILLIIACIGLGKNLRSKPTWAFLCAPGVGLVLIAANPYGNEGIFRAALFAIPWLAAASLLVVPANPARLFTGVFAVLAFVLTGTYLVSQGALDDSNVIRVADYRALLDYQAISAPDSYLMTMGGTELPVSIDHPDLADHNLIWSNLLTRAQAGDLTPTAADANDLAKQFYSYGRGNGGASTQLYAIWSPAAVDYAVDYGLQTLAQAEAWRNLMIASPDWTVVYHSDGTYLFRVSSAVYKPAKAPAVKPVKHKAKK